MKILEIAWKNFMSYGNIWQTLKFDQGEGLNLISGMNGSGKCVKFDTEIDIKFVDVELEQKFKDFLENN